MVQFAIAEKRETSSTSTNARTHPFTIVEERERGKERENII